MEIFPFAPRHLTDDDKTVVKYQRHQSTIKAIIAGNFSLIEERDIDDLLRAWAERGGSTQIPELIYEDVRFSIDDVKKLSKIIRADTPANIRVLRMTRNSLNEYSSRIFLKALAGNRTFREITITNNNIGDKGAKYIMRLLYRNPCLISIDLCNNSIGPDGARLINDGLKENYRLERICVRGNRLGPSGAAAFGETLKSNRTIRHLDLGLNKMQAIGVAAIARALHNNRGLDSISLDLNEMGYESTVCLADALRVNKYLAELRIPLNNISDKGIIWICAALMDNRQIRSLDLEGNSIGMHDNSGAEAIANLVRNNSTLRMLDLSSNPLGDEGMKCIADALHENHSLERLILTRCNIGFEGIRALAEAIPHNNRLQYLVLTANAQLGLEEHSLLANALKSNYSLKGLYLDFNHGDWEPAYNSIEQSLTRNHLLQRSRYSMACAILRAARVILNGRPLPSHIPHAKNIASLPNEILERIFLMMDSTAALMLSEVRHVARIAAKKETLARRLTKAAFLEITLGAYFEEEGEKSKSGSNAPLGWGGGLRVRFVE